MPFRGCDIDQPDRFSLRNQRHAGVESKPLIIPIGQKGIMQTGTLNDIDRMCDPSSQKQVLAQGLVDFLVSPAAQEIFTKFGFGKP